METLREFFEHELQDVYAAERLLTESGAWRGTISGGRVTEPARPERR